MRNHASFAKEATEENPGIEEENAVTKLPEWDVNKDNDSYDGKWDECGLGESRCQGDQQEKVNNGIGQIVVTAAQGSHLWFKYSLDKQPDSTS